MQRIMLFLWMMRSDLGQSVNSNVLFCILGETFFIACPPQLVARTANDFVEQNLCGSFDAMDVLGRLAATISSPLEDLIPNMLTRITWFVRSVLSQPYFHAYLAPSRIFETLCSSITIYATVKSDPEASWRARRDALSIVRYAPVASRLDLMI